MEVILISEFSFILLNSFGNSVTKLNDWLQHVFDSHRDPDRAFAFENDEESVTLLAFLDNERPLPV